MQTAIERVFRNFSFRATVPHADDRHADLSRDEAVSMAARLLENYKTDVRLKASQH
jgi:hypothetical protein